MATPIFKEFLRYERKGRRLGARVPRWLDEISSPAIHGVESPDIYVIKVVFVRRSWAFTGAVVILRDECSPSIPVKRLCNSIRFEIGRGCCCPSALLLLSPSFYFITFPLSFPCPSPRIYLKYLVRNSISYSSLLFYKEGSLPYTDSAM